MIPAEISLGKLHRRPGDGNVIVRYQRNKLPQTATKGIAKLWVSKLWLEYSSRHHIVTFKHIGHLWIFLMEIRSSLGYHKD